MNYAPSTWAATCCSWHSSMAEEPRRKIMRFQVQCRSISELGGAVKCPTCNRWFRSPGGFAVQECTTGKNYTIQCTEVALLLPNQELLSRALFFYHCSILGVVIWAHLRVHVRVPVCACACVHLDIPTATVCILGLTFN